jgi:hypothetical protein
MTAAADQPIDSVKRIFRSQAESFFVATNLSIQISYYLLNTGDIP